MAYLDNLTEQELELELAIAARCMLNLVPFGPLTADEADAEERYLRYCEERETDYQEELAAGGRTVCPQCGHRSVTHRSVVTYGYEGHPGADYSDLASCERCDYKEI